MRKSTTFRRIGGEGRTYKEQRKERVEARLAGVKRKDFVGTESVYRVKIEEKWNI